MVVREVDFACYVPSILREIINDSKDIGTSNCSYKSFKTLMLGLFMGQTSFCDCSRNIVDSPSVSTLSRAAASLNGNKLFNRSVRKVANYISKQKNYKNRYILIADDTLKRKYGEDSGFWFDHTTQAKMKGNNYLAIIVYDTYMGYTYPISFTLLYNKGHENYEKRTEVLKKELIKLKKLGFGELTLCADTWFGSHELFDWLETHNFKFEIQIKQNRKVTYYNKTQTVISKNGKKSYPNAQDLACSLGRDVIFSGDKPKQAAGGVVKLFGSQLRLRMTAVWNKDSTPDEKPFSIYVTNRTEVTNSKVWVLARHRWAIECSFRLLKQVFRIDSFAVSPNSSENLVKTTLFMYSALEMKRQQKNNSIPRPTSASQKRTLYESLSAYIHRVRTESKNTFFTSALNNKNIKNKTLNHIKYRKNPERAVLKPRDRLKIKQQSIISA